MRYKIREYIFNTWNGVMDARYNPLKNIPDLHVQHMVMQVLAFMWSVVFGVMIAESVFAFGISAIAHTALLAAIVITVATFKVAENSPYSFVNGYHSVNRTRNYIWTNGTKTKLDDMDPGGEHE